MEKYNKVIIYYFTGTGNALKAGRWICEEAGKRNIESRIQAIDDKYRANAEELDDKTLIGFLSPTHGFNLAPAMVKFINKFPAKKNADVFILNTRAGLKFSKIFFPGISGTAQFLPMIVLKLKGYRIIGGLPLDMPSNWIFLHPGLNPSAVSAIVKRCEGKTRAFINNIFSGKKVFIKMLVTLPLDISLLPIAVVYYFYGRFALAKTMIYTSNCNNCMVCVDNCPVKAIKILNDKPYWSYSCESCMRCINICPKTSIQTSHLVILFIAVVPGFIFNNFLVGFIKLPGFINYEIVLSIIGMAITLVELFVFYAIIQRFLKYKYFGNLFKYTSLSAYWRRYLAPGISLSDFRKDK